MNHSTADTDSHTFVARARRRSETNIVWLKRVMPAIKKLEEQHVEHPTFVLLFGGRSAYDFRLRVAQSPFRHDVSPSHWSHAAMIRNADLADWTTPSCWRVRWSPDTASACPRPTTACRPDI